MVVSPPPLVVARDVRKSFRTTELTTPVLRGVTFAVARGALAAVVGPSGCGKTTLLSLVGALDRPDGGELLVDGLDLVAANEAARSHYRRIKIGFVFQFYNLLPSLTALENVEAALEFSALDRPARRRRALDYLERVNLAEAAHRFPAQLSGGMQQRVALARALAREPALLLCDEPTGNLDRENGERVFELLRSLQRSLQLSCLLVTHDANLAARCDSIIRLADGRVEGLTEGAARCAS